PGAMALLRMLYLPHSAAGDRVSARTPPFAAADGATKPEPVNADVVPLFTILAGCRLAIQRSPKANLQFPVPFRQKTTIVENAFDDSLSVGEIKLPAALLISPCISPNRSSA